MKTTAKHVACLTLAGLLAAALGCSQKPSEQSPLDTPSKLDLAPQNRPPIAEKEGYWHRQSGVGFLYPDGWENLGVTLRGPVTSLGLRKGQGAIEVTLYWTAPDGPIDTETIGQTEWSALSSLYGDKLGRPEPIVAQKKSGYRLKIGGGPLGEGGPQLAGVVYVFAVKAGQDWWKIKLRGTARDKDKLQEVEKLLDNYRWQP